MTVTTEGSGMTDPDHQTVTPSDYQRDSIDELASYIEREEEATLRDRTGQEMDSQNLQRLIDKSERHEMSRHIVISPENADSLDRQEMDSMAKRTLRDTLGEREGVDYAYAVHEDGGDRPHAHVAATGRANGADDPLWLDADDLQEMADVAHEHSLEVSRGKTLQKAVEIGLSQGKGVGMFR